MSSIIPISDGSCPVCNTGNPEVITYSDEVNFRGLELDVEDLQESKCRKCGHKWVTKKQLAHNNLVIRDAYALERDELREKHGLLTAHEIARIREYFELGQREAASLFGGGYNAFNKYESGEVLQSFAMDRLLRLTAAVGMPAVDFLKDVYSAPSFIVISRSKTSHGYSFTISIGGGTPYVSNTIEGTSTLISTDTPRVVPERLANWDAFPAANRSVMALPRWDSYED